MSLFRPFLSASVILAAACASATTWIFDYPVQGIQEVPSNSSPAVGHAFGTYNDVTNALDCTVTVTGLTANATAAHIHQAAAGVSGGVIIPFTGTTGTTSYTSHITPTMTAAQETAFLAGNTYANVHTTAFPGGEVRGQLYPLAVIEANDVNLTEGDLNDGDLSRLFASDDLYYEAVSDSTTLGAKVEITGTTVAPTPTKLMLNGETSVARPGLAELVEEFRFSTSSFVTVSGRAAPLSDATFSVSVATPGPDFVGPSNKILARVSWMPINDEDPSQDGWLQFIDRFYWLTR